MLPVLALLIIASLFSSLAVPLFLINIYLSSIRYGNSKRREDALKALGISSTNTNKKKLVGFFHPYCNAGGGGERVLWTAVASIQRTEPDVVCVVYSGDVTATKEDILATAKARFDISLDPTKIIFVFLQHRKFVEDSAWPFFTLLGQSLGSMYLAFEGMNKLIPDLYIDTMGYAFTFHVVRWVARVPVGAYVHYPTISTDMLKRVRERKKWHTNKGVISSSPVLSGVKLIYYRIFMYYYSLSLRSAQFVMVNSTWTKNHVDSILRHSDSLIDFFHLVNPPFLLFRLLSWTSTKPVTSSRIVYPPCDTREMTKFPLVGSRERFIISVAQFRPEKDHPAQLHALHELFQSHPEYKEEGVKLVMIGGSRNVGDAERVEGLRVLAKELGLEDRVELLVNAPYPDMLERLSKASIGMNTMVDEHFGINVVEYMAAGVIPVVHASAGPLYDIVVPFNGGHTGKELPFSHSFLYSSHLPSGYHATTSTEFAEALHTALSLTPEEDMAIRHRARTWAVQRFSEEEFEKGWDASGWKRWL